MKLITTPETISEVAQRDVDQPEQVGAQAQGEAIDHVQNVGATQMQPEDSTSQMTGSTAASVPSRNCSPPALMP